jgi:hypothetical protein
MRSFIRTFTRTGLAAGSSLLAGALLAGTLLAAPAHADAVVPKLTFQPDVMCSSSLMVYGLDVTNEGDPVTIRVTKFTPGSVVANEVDLATGASTTLTLDTPHYKIVRLRITVDGTTVYDTDEITSTGTGSGCNIPVPALRDDIDFDITATCGEVAANYTISATSPGPEAMVDLTWIGKNGVPSYHGIQVNGPSHTEIVEVGVVNHVFAYDAWGRQLFSSGDLVADGEGCPRAAIHLIDQKVDLECVDGSPRLFIWALNSGDYVENFEVKWQAGVASDGVGETQWVTVPTGDTYDKEVAFPAGKSLLVTLTSYGAANPFFLLEMPAEETTCGTDGNEGNEPPSDTSVPDNGNEAPAPTTTQPAPVTTVTPRSLPVTGRTSTSLVIVAAALLLSGLSIRLVGRRRA